MNARPSENEGENKLNERNLGDNVKVFSHSKNILLFGAGVPLVIAARTFPAINHAITWKWAACALRQRTSASQQIRQNVVKATVSSNTLIQSETRLDRTLAGLMDRSSSARRPT